MRRKSASAILAFIFVFTVVMSAWSYCPGPKKKHCSNMQNEKTEHSVKLKTPHRSCDSLKDVYNIQPYFEIAIQKNGKLLKSPTVDSGSINQIIYRNAQDLSPPLRGSPPQEIALYLQYSILRI
ncbi:MAG: hypothetical protein ACUZ8I_17780 [Candidatus Scalindua sp.]